MIKLYNQDFVSIGGKGIQIKDPSSAPTIPPTVVISTAASLVDGLFHVSIVFSMAVTGFVLGDITVTNGSAQYLTSSDNITFTAYIVPNGVDDVQVSIAQGVCVASDGALNAVSNTLTVTINTAWKFLVKSSTSNLFYDFRELYGIEDTNVLASDSGIRDLSANARNGALVNTVKVSQVATFNSLKQTTGAGAAAINTQGTGSTYLNTNFSVFFALSSDDGQNGASYFIAGNVDGTPNTGVTFSFTNVGVLRIGYQGMVWQSSAAALPNGATGTIYFDIHFDFTTDVLTVNKNGVAVVGTFTTSNITAVNPASYACTANLWVGARNDNGTARQDTAATARLLYFACTTLNTTSTPINTYLLAKKAALQLMSTLSNSQKLPAAHYVALNPAKTIAAVVSKGNTTLTSVDGAFTLISLADPSTPTILDSQFGQGDMIDARTCVWISATRVVVFTLNKAILYNVSNPAAISRLSTLAYTGNINGAELINSQVVAANTSGFLQIFGYAGDTLTLVDSYDTNSHDSISSVYDVYPVDTDNVAIANINTGASFAIYKIFNNGTLLPSASWTLRGSLDAASIDTANRVVVVGSIAATHQNSGGTNVVTINISDLTNPVQIYDFSLDGNHSSGKCLYRNKLDIAANGYGVTILDITANPVLQYGGYIDSTNFTSDIRNTHEVAWYTVANQNYCIATYQNDTDDKIAIFKINRI